MESFSKSTILGLTFGILLAFGIAVSAFQSPTQAPPGGNVLAPVNVGPGPQVKSGGLWVGSLGVDGGVQVGGSIKVGGFVALPACGVSTKGTFVFNTNINKISVCTGTAWEVFPTAVDFDNDGFGAGTDCNDGNATVWQNLGCYIDEDGDGIRSTYTTNVCSGVSCLSPTGNPGTDCDGANVNIFQSLASMVTDADHDRAPTAIAAATQCVGTSSTINGRVYYKNASGAFTWCANTVCTGVTDPNDADPNQYGQPAPKTCSFGGAGYRTVKKTGLTAACAAYCSATFPPSVSCSFEAASGSYEFDSFNYSDCSLQTYNPSSATTPICTLGLPSTDEFGNTTYFNTTCTCLP